MWFDPAANMRPNAGLGFVRAWALADTLRDKGLNAYFSLSWDGLERGAQRPNWHFWPRNGGGVGVYYNSEDGAYDASLLTTELTEVFEALDKLPQNPTREEVWAILSLAEDPTA